MLRAPRALRCRLPASSLAELAHFSPLGLVVPCSACPHVCGRVLSTIVFDALGIEMATPHAEVRHSREGLWCPVGDTGFSHCGKHTYHRIQYAWATLGYGLCAWIDRGGVCVCVFLRDYI